MPRTRIISSQVTEPAPKRWSNLIRAGDHLYVSGLTSRNKDGTTIDGAGEYEQSNIIFTKIRHLMEAAGASMDDVVKLTIFVTRIEHNAEVWKARAEFFEGDFPACSLVEVKGLAAPNIYVEIEGIAYTGVRT
ncbi:MAG: 2-iminobutanoate/2-iminopropanoate deaminase [Gammaproteobacteria bacterium]|jgi:2-iminobutanoate/2-iminopropanoate deaminase